MAEGAEAYSALAISVSAACVRENRRGARRVCTLAVQIRQDLVFICVYLRLSAAHFLPFLKKP